MDGVLQSPSGKDEDNRNGFKWGGWSRPYWDDLMGEEFNKVMANPFDLLMGRSTYEMSTTGAVFTNYALDEGLAWLFHRYSRTGYQN